MTLTTENLQKHLDGLEKKRTETFFTVHATLHRFSRCLYAFNIFIAVAGIAIFAINRISVHTHHAYFLQWSTVLSVVATMIALFHYLFILDKSTVQAHHSTCTILDHYDDEYRILRKYMAGEIEEPAIRQFYIRRSAQTHRLACNMARPNIISWTAVALLLAALSLSALA